mmetsp:Transcript_56910/g.138580  ORF Transcript_56910/g.138580 Transcript_56910/m.138580 type:complete len:577 (-) Transcript_56910:3200-4930(-)
MYGLTTMVLQQDKEVAVSKDATSTIQQYVNCMGFGDTSSMVSTIIELIEKLPVLAQGGKRTETRMHFQLLTGYLSSMGHKGASGLATSDILKRCLIQIADVDLASVEKTHVASVINEVVEGSVIESRYFDFELTGLFHNMLLTLGRSLGVKYGALVVDSILADFSLASQSKPSRDDAFLDWLHKWIGSLVVGRMIIKGAFGNVRDERKDSKKSQKHAKVIESFAISISPLLVRSQLWDTSQSQESSRQRPSPHMVQSKSCVVVLILEFFRDLCTCLKSQIRSIIPVLLFPIVEKVSQSNIPSVQVAASQTLLAMTLADNKQGDIETFVTDHQRILGSAMLGQLRISNGSQVPRQADKERILDVSRAALWILQAVYRCTEGNHMLRTSHWIDLVELLHSRLAHLFVQQILVEEDISCICQLYSSFFRLLLYEFGVDAGEIYTFKTIGEYRNQNQPWRDALMPFRKSKKNGIHSDQEKKVDIPEIKSLDLTDRDIELCSKLTAQGCYLLSNSSLRIRVQACDFLTLGFQFLAFVGNYHEVRPISSGETMPKSLVLKFSYILTFPFPFVPFFTRIGAPG